jgi:uncharacterized protein (TIGR02266 family)
LIIAERERPDIIFMDLFMPKMNGDECCRRIKEHVALKRTPVVMVTQDGNDRDLELCLQAGCDEILFKPVDRSRFLSMAGRFLNVPLRQSPRFSAHIPVQFSSPKNPQARCLSLNISNRGIFIEAGSAESIGTELKLSFLLETMADPIECRARVAWLNSSMERRQAHYPTGMGLEFIDLSDDYSVAIEAYLKKLRPFPG